MKLSENHSKLLKTAINHVFSCWTALSLAIFHECAGPHSEKMQNELLDSVFNALIANRARNAEDVSDLLYNFFDTRFMTDLEDDSDFEVAEKIFNLYKTLLNNDESYALSILNNEKATLPTQSKLDENQQQPILIDTKATVNLDGINVDSMQVPSLGIDSDDESN